MGAVAQNLFKDILYSQVVTKPVLFAQQFLDHNHNGLISVQEEPENPLFQVPLAGNLTLVLSQSSPAANGTAERLNPQYNTNNDTFTSINNELKPRLLEDLKSFYRLENCNTRWGVCCMPYFAYITLRSDSYFGYHRQSPFRYIYFNTTRKE